MQYFEIGKTYSMRSACDYECIWVYTVGDRTEHTVTLINDSGRVVKCRINARVSAYNNAETVYPLGRYSMAPSLSASASK